MAMSKTAARLLREGRAKLRQEETARRRRRELLASSPDRWTVEYAPRDGGRRVRSGEFLTIEAANGRAANLESAGHENVRVIKIR